MIAVAGADLAQTLVSGVALGAKYALVALGFVVIFKATGVINFAQASFVLVGGYLTWYLGDAVGLPFYAAMAVSVLVGAALGVVTEALVLRRLVGEAPFTVVMVTIGLLYVIDNSVTAIWGPDTHNLGDPWRIGTRTVGGVVLADRDLWAIAITAVVLGGFFAFFRYSSLGLGMRATALDPEAAIAQGIRAATVYRVSWAIAGGVAALAGTMLATGSAAVQPGLGQIALAAFPAMILGGLDSPLGAVVGGLVIGLVQQLTALFAPEVAPWLGHSFELVAPYLVMVVILLVRPFGLFGTPEVRRA